MNATAPRTFRPENRLTRLGLLTEPAGYVDGVNLYEYVGDNPVIRLDPMGHQSTQPATQPTTQPSTQPTTQPSNQPTTQPHDPKTCPTCNSANVAADTAIATSKTENGFNCLGWAFYDDRPFMRHLGFGAASFEKIIGNKATRVALIKAKIDKCVTDKGGSFLDNPNKDCPCGMRKVGVVLREFIHNTDVHPITQHTDGSWSEKPDFTSNVRRVDINAHVRTLWGMFFKEATLIGYYCVNAPPRCSPGQMGI